mmetsp:Transcript_16395/g.37651  ORF Transcript_16395/g.37651 Transcript_16395/m.37651 type:complete len:225 (-) Transcript_16395:66-740(-)|eukprot:CAMPEP_0116848264 /NCGR_PEP_ID=MMETSP0418-20121206/14897_1 /TAXON_ID=1158023 /ORGANISM="Astrosyne radiata, Strain 13vi08-1A" /LENGTH=224 /DNA_ID=CAMNT_0004479809 /DNA_START=57 /DNA_END=731 /DNA_ORIENTATION=-
MPLLHKNIHDEKHYSLILGDTRSVPASPEIVTSNIKGKRRLQTPKRSVKYVEMVEVYETISLDEMTMDERARTWYSKKDLKRIKADLVPTARLMGAGKISQDDEEHCTRGLEIRTRVGCEQRKINKRRGWDAVLNEQDRQRAIGDNDTEALASAYIQANMPCRKAALMTGLRDELMEYPKNALVEPPQAPPADKKATNRKTYLMTFLKRSTNNGRVNDNKTTCS